MSREYKYVYFIESHNLNEDKDIKLSMDYEEAKELKCVFCDIKEEDKKKYKYSIYRFDLYPPKNNAKEKKKEIKINLANQDSNFDGIISIQDFTRDTFIYDFKFNKFSEWGISIDPPESYKFNYIEQFEIYLDYLRNKLKVKQKDQENLDFILSTQCLLVGKGKTFLFSFYILIFLECFATDLLTRHLAVFKTDKIEGIGEIPKKKTVLADNIMKKKLEEKPEQVLDKYNDPKQKDDIGIKLYTLILYYNYIFHRNRMQEVINTNKEIAKKYIYLSLLKFNDLFKELKLTKDQIKSLVDISENYGQLLCILNYSNNLFDLLQIITENEDKFFKYYSSAVIKTNINVESMITPQKDDNIKGIHEQYKKLIESENKKKIQFLILSCSLLENYISYFENTNYENLYYIKEIVAINKKLNKKDINKKIKSSKKLNNISDTIHNTGINLSKEKKLTNMEILNFIEKDEFYNSSTARRMYRSLDVLNGLNFESFDEEFYSKWKKMDWTKIFGENYSGFLVRITDFITNMKNFNVLFKLFDTSKNEKPKFEALSLNQMQIKFFELQKNYDPKECPNFENDLILLLYYSDRDNVNLEDFMKSKLEKNLKVEFVNEIYIKYISTYQNKVSSNTQQFITRFFTQTLDNQNPNSLLYLIKKCPYLSEQILSSIDKYNIQKEDFMQLDENDNLILFKGLLEDKIIENENYKDTYYVDHALKELKELDNEINKLEIKYRDISLFCNEDLEENKKDNKEDNKENKLKTRLKIIALNNEEKAEKYYSLIFDNYSEIRKILNDLQTILEDFLLFFPNTENENIGRVREIINEIKAGKLNCYKEKYVDKINELTTKYLDKAKERFLKKKSFIYMNIFKKNQILYKRDDKKCLNETEKNFEKIKDIFNIGPKKGLKNDKKVYQIYIDTIKEKKSDEIDNEIVNLMKIFNLDEDKCNKEAIKKSMILLTKREYLLKVVNALIVFIEKTKINKDKLWETAKDIKENLEKTKEEEYIEESLKKLKEKPFCIDVEILSNKEINENEKNYLNILLQLSRKSDSIAFLMEMSIADCRRLQELVGEKDNQFLNANDVIELEKCIEFMNKVVEENGNIREQKDYEIIQILKEESLNNKDIAILFAKYVNNFEDLHSLKDSGFDKSEYSKKKIELICKKSTFTLKNEKKKKNFEGFYYEEKNNEDEIKMIKKQIDLNTLLDLRDRAQLTRKVTGDEKEKQDLDNFKKFIERVSEIYNLYDVLEDLYISGYHEVITLVIEINNYESTFRGLNEKTNDYKEMYMKLVEILNQLKSTQEKGYNEKPLIRFIHGRQFNLVYNTIKINEEDNGLEQKQKEKEMEKIKPFLMFLTDKNIEYKGVKYKYKSTDNKYNDLINNCEEYLEKILVESNLSEDKSLDKSLKKIYDESLIKLKDEEQRDYKGIYIYLCDKVEKKLFQIYKYLTGNSPKAKNILLCNKETTKEEITAFLYRSILCKYKSCFVIGEIELLEFEKQILFLELLNKLYKIEDMKSCLIILYTNKNSEIIKSLDSVKDIKIFKSKKIKESDLEKQNIDDNKDNRVEIYKSDKSGVGKSTQIKLKIEKNGHKYIHFPLGGVFNRKDIIRRLKKLQITDNCGIHLDLYDTDKTDLMLEFLFSILITKFYGQNEDIYYLPNNFEIKVEIPNGFINFIEKFPILSLFHIEELKIKELAPLIVSNQLTSNEQIVANYLKALNDKTIDDNDLYIEGISSQDLIIEEDLSKLSVQNRFKNKYIKATVLSQKDCQEIIFK